MNRIWIATVAAIVLVLGLVAFLVLRDAPEQADRAPEPEGISPATASLAEEKLSRLESGGEEVRLSGVELTSLVRFRPEIWNLGGVVEPSVRMAGDTLQLHGSFPSDRLPPAPELEAIRFLLPDTIQIDVAGTLRARDGRGPVLDVGSVEIADMPIPGEYYPLILEQLGRPPDADLPASAILLPLPPSVRSARVEDGELVLTP